MVLNGLGPGYLNNHLFLDELLLTTAECMNQEGPPKLDPLNCNLPIPTYRNERILGCIQHAPLGRLQPLASFLSLHCWYKRVVTDGRASTVSAGRHWQQCWPNNAGQNQRCSCVSWVRLAQQHFQAVWGRAGGQAFLSMPGGVPAQG